MCHFSPMAQHMVPDCPQSSAWVLVDLGSAADPRVPAWTPQLYLSCHSPSLFLAVCQGREAGDGRASQGSEQVRRVSTVTRTEPAMQGGGYILRFSCCGLSCLPQALPNTPISWTFRNSLHTHLADSYSTIPGQATTTGILQKPPHWSPGG
jgi:hypothetical protein